MKFTVEHRGLGAAGSWARRGVGLIAVSCLLHLAGCDCNNGSTSDGGLADSGPDADPAGPKPGILGRFSALAASGEKLMASAYESSFGDLVLVSASTSDLTKHAREIVDGVPATTTPKAGWRGGVEEPGDDVGQDTDLAVGSDGEPMIGYLDVTNRALKFAFRSAGKWTSHTVQKPVGSKEVVGRHAALLLVNGKPALAYLVVNIAATAGSFKSELRWAAASKATPTTSADWSISTIDSGLMPCQGLCTSPEVCAVKTDGSSACATVGTGCSTCSSGEACVAGACTKTLSSSKIVDVPYATGLWPSPVLASGTPIVLYYDRVKGSLKGARQSGTAWQTATIKGGTTGVDLGAFCTAALDSTGTIHVTYQDAGKLTLLYSQVNPSSLAATVTETIDDGVRSNGVHPVGADSALLVDSAGKVRVIYQDSLTTDLLSVTRAGANNWTPKTSGDADLGRRFKGGARGYGFYSQLVLAGGKVYGSTFSYDPKATPKGALEFFTLP